MKLVKTKNPKHLLNIYRLYLKAFPKNERKPFPFILLKQWRGSNKFGRKDKKKKFLSEK